MLGLRLRLLRAQAPSLPPEALRRRVEGNVHDWDALPTAQRATYLAMAAEALRIGGIADVSLAKRAVAAADTEHEPNLRRQTVARNELRLAIGR